MVAPLGLLGCAFRSLHIANNLGKFLDLTVWGFFLFVWLVVLLCWWFFSFSIEKSCVPF